MISHIVCTLIGVFLGCALYDLVIDRKKHKCEPEVEDTPELEPEPVVVKKLSDELEEQYFAQHDIYKQALHEWSVLFDKVEWKKGTLREILSAELIIGDAKKKYQLEESKLVPIREKFKEAIKNEQST